jgi:hypothetical protein
MANSGGNDLTSGIAGLAGFIAIPIFLITIFLYDFFTSKDKIILNKMSINS